MNKITILGAGSFGFALAKVMGENNSDKDFFIYDVQRDFVDHIRKTRKHPIFHGETKLPEHIKATHSLEEAVVDADLILLAMPSQYLRMSVNEFKGFLTKKTVFLSLIKGLEANTDMRPSEVVADEMKTVNVEYEFCAFSGGMIAREVTLEHPLCADLACENRDTAKKVARLLWNDHLRIETSSDVIGVELAGAFKNVIAIGAGLFDGLGYGESSKSAFVSAASKQIVPLALSFGADEKTFGPGSQAWFGDLMTTCFGNSRNRGLGELIGKGMTVEEAVEDMQGNNLSVEGYVATKVVHDMMKNKNIEAPLLEMIYNVLYKKYLPSEFLKDFIKSW